MECILVERDVSSRQLVAYSKMDLQSTTRFWLFQAGIGKDPTVRVVGAQQTSEISTAYSYGATVLCWDRMMWLIRLLRIEQTVPWKWLACNPDERWALGAALLQPHQLLWVLLCDSSCTIPCGWGNHCAKWIFRSRLLSLNNKRTNILKWGDANTQNL